MSINNKGFELDFEAPNGNFVFLDSARVIKCYPDLNLSCLIVRKGNKEYHLRAYDHKNHEYMIKDEIRGILNCFFPSYCELMSESLKGSDTDHEKKSLGIALGMKVYAYYRSAIIHFRSLYTHEYKASEKFKGKLPLGDPEMPKDHFNLSYVFRHNLRGDKKIYLFDGSVFQHEVMKYLVETYQIIHPEPEPRIFKNNLTDAWVFRGKSV